MRQVFRGWGVALKRKTVIYCLRYIFRTRCYMMRRASHNVEGLLFMVTTLSNHYGGVFIMQKTRWNTKTITFLALLIALQVIFGDVLAITISATNKVSLGPVAAIMAGLWLGPVPGLLCGICADLIGFFAAPQAFPFNPFITLAAGVWGLIPGLLRILVFKFESKAKKSLILVISIIISAILGTFVLTTMGLVILSGLKFANIYWTRLLQMAVGIPVYSIATILLYFSPLTKLIINQKQN